MSEVNISINTRNEIEGKVSTKQKINANIYPRGPQGLQGRQGIKGDTGNGIVSIEKTSTVGLVDTYTITFTNGSTFNFTVTNANAGNTYTKSEIEQFLDQKVNISDIINTLTSDETNKPLSAKQGKVLKGLIDNTYTSSEIDAFLSTINSNISNLNDTKLNKTVVTDAYSSSSTYSVGDYCIYGNTLYKCTTAISTAETWNSGHWTAVSVADEINARVKKSGDTMTGDLAMNDSVIKIASGITKGIQNSSDKPIIRDHGNGNVTVDATDDTLFLGFENTVQINCFRGKVRVNNDGGVWWQEDGYGDKFRIIPDFNGAGSSNRLLVQSTVGDAGTDPTNWKTLVSIHAETGEVDFNANDTGWQEIPLTSPTTTPAWNVLMYRKINGVVYIKGTIFWNQSPSWNMQVAQLPVGVRPPNEFDIVCRSQSTKSGSIIAISADGKISYLENTDTSTGEGCWINCSFIAGT